MKRLYWLSLLSLLLALAIFFGKKRMPSTIAAGEGLVLDKAWLAPNKNPITPQADARAADQTFLTFPEWYLVFSPAEQADYFKHTTASSFPFMQHTAQIWQGYQVVNNQIKDNFPVNTGYHFMIWVIGSSASAEYAIKTLYETIVGRLTDTHTVITEEDRFNARFTQQYVDFIKDQPWYAFDFKSRLGCLWHNVSFTGGHYLRKMERRYILTSELLVKWGYGKLIGLGTQTVYDAALPTTAVILDSAFYHPSYLQAGKPSANHSVLVYLPRYDKFNAAAMELAMAGNHFREIAGNRSAILLTVVGSSADMQLSGARIIFRQPFASNPGLQRTALAVPVPQLHELLLQLKQKNIKIEHVFDF